MPIGIIINSLGVAVGGIVGTIAGDKLKDNFKKNMTDIFGVCSIAMGAYTLSLMQNMPACVLSVVLGTAIGLFIHLGDKIQKCGVAMQKVVSKFVKSNNAKMSEEEFMQQVVTCMVLFCAGATGIYGSMIEGLSGDHSVMLTKAILDTCTAMIFSCSLGLVISTIAVPQFCICMILFVLSGMLFPLTTPVMILDFKAVGGFIMIASGFRILKLKMLPTRDMIPSMILAMPISFLWVNYVIPLIS